MGGSIGIGRQWRWGAIACLTAGDCAAGGRLVHVLGAGAWTQAREQLDITTIVFANRAYAILRHELANVGAVMSVARRSTCSTRAALTLTGPLARGMGVPAVRAETMEELNRVEQGLNPQGRS